jgi:hypothetical protein
LENHHSAILAAVEAKIGRKLTVREAARGIDRAHLTEPQRLQLDLKWQGITAPPAEPGKPVNPWLKKIQEEEDRELRESNPHLYDLKKESELWEQKRQEAERIKTLANDPKRIAVQKAIHEFEILTKWDSRHDNLAAADLAKLKEFSKTASPEKCAELLNEQRANFVTTLKNLQKPSRLLLETSQIEIYAAEKPYSLPTVADGNFAQAPIENQV